MTHLTRTDPAKSLARFYSAHIARSLFGEWELVREWGRIGQGGTRRVDAHDRDANAAAALAQLARAKTRRGYRSNHPMKDQF